MMHDGDSAAFDRRIATDQALELLRKCQVGAPCALGGGAALSGVYLKHRFSDDFDLFFDSQVGVRNVLMALPTIAGEIGVPLDIVQDAGAFVRARIGFKAGAKQLDLIHEPVPLLTG